MVSDYFYLGMTLEVLTEDGKFMFLAKVSDIDSDFIKIVNAKGGTLPPTFHGTVIKLRGFLSGMRPVNVQSQICGNSPDFWKLDHIQGMYTHENRANFRQRVSIDTTLIPANSIFGGSSDQPSSPVPCRILDISVGGVQVSCRAKFQNGDWFFLPDVSIVDDFPPFSFTCSVRRTSENSTGYLYGCQIDGLTAKEQEELLRAIFSAQRQEIQKRRERNG